MRLGLMILIAMIVLTPSGCAPARRGDTLVLRDGTVLRDCYVRDEGTHYAVWPSLPEVGDAPIRYARAAVQHWEIHRTAEWDARPDRADLTITHIELDPKLPSLQGLIRYDRFGRPRIEGDCPRLREMGQRHFTDPDGIVSDIRFRYQPGEEVTLTAHVKNVGFRAAAPFEVEWRMDDAVVARAAHAAPLGEMETATFRLPWEWQEGAHEVACRIVTDQPEIATTNNVARDALAAFGLVFVVSNEQVTAWHTVRNAYGTFCLEDYCRWHLDIVNRLMAASVYPAAPDGCQARVRLDRIIYVDGPVAPPVEDTLAAWLRAADGLRYDQGVLVWRDAAGCSWPEPASCRVTQWGFLPQIGHALGLVAWHGLEYAGDPQHVWPDTREPVTHRVRHGSQIMARPGPHLFGEADTAYLNATRDQPRGYHGDYLFALPRHILLLVTDINGRPVSDANIAVYQRGTRVEHHPQSFGEEVTYFAVAEDGDFERPLSEHPVITASTDDTGVLRLPDRPAEAVRSIGGFHRQANPFGNLDVGGQRGLLLIHVRKDGREAYFWLEVQELVIAWFRGQRSRYVVPLQTPFPSRDSPPAPASVEATQLDAQRVRLRWQPAAPAHPSHPLETITGYRVYQRIGNEGLRDAPWVPVATLTAEQREIVLDVPTESPNRPFFPPVRVRFGVTSLGPADVQSELVCAPPM